MREAEGGGTRKPAEPGRGEDVLPVAPRLAVLRLCLFCPSVLCLPLPPLPCVLPGDAPGLSLCLSLPNLRYFVWLAPSPVSLCP